MPAKTWPGGDVICICPREEICMSRTSKAGVAAGVERSIRARAPESGKRGFAVKANGHQRGEDDSFDLQILLDALQSVRVGDFSVRLPRDRMGLAGKVAECFNE